MDYGRDQQLAIRQAGDWAQTLYKNIFVIGGFAGTGKSTVLSQVLLNMRIGMYKVAFATYTGKAAIVLRQKGLNAFTLHKLLYNIYIGPSNKPIFKLKNRLPSNIELIVIDEFGMVPDKIIRDAASFGIPILGLGDPGQLPPIYGENSYMKNADVFLSEVFRQKGDSSLLQLATDIRNGENIYRKKYNSDVKIIEYDKFELEDMLEYKQVLCGTNATRTFLNMEYRKIKEYDKSVLPLAGEKLMCLVNNFKEPLTSSDRSGDVELYLVNGLSGYSHVDAWGVSSKVAYTYFRPDFLNISSSVAMNTKPFYDYYDIVADDLETANDDMLQYDDSGKIINRFDFGYAITTHKSQGSEWDSILVMDDCRFFDKENYVRWLYTSVTRAKKTVTIVKNVKIN